MLVHFGGQANNGGGGEFFNGSLDDLRIYDHALSQAEVRRLVPEPSASTLCLLALAGLLRRKRR